MACIGSRVQIPSGPLFTGLFRVPYAYEYVKLAKDEIERARDASPMDLFAQGIRSKETLDKYTRTLRKITCEFLEDILEVTFEELVVQLVRHGRGESECTRDLLLNLSKNLRDRLLHPRLRLRSTCGANTPSVSWMILQCPSFYPR